MQSSCDHHIVEGDAVRVHDTFVDVDYRLTISVESFAAANEMAMAFATLAARMRVIGQAKAELELCSPHGESGPPTFEETR